MGTRVGQSCISQPNNPLVTYIINVTLSICTEVTRCEEEVWSFSLIVPGRVLESTSSMSCGPTGSRDGSEDSPSPDCAESFVKILCAILFVIPLALKVK